MNGGIASGLATLAPVPGSHDGTKLKIGQDLDRRVWIDEEWRSWDEHNRRRIKPGPSDTGPAVDDRQIQQRRFADESSRPTADPRFINCPLIPWASILIVDPPCKDRFTARVDDRPPVRRIENVTVGDPAAMQRLHKEPQVGLCVAVSRQLPGMPHITKADGRETENGDAHECFGQPHSLLPAGRQ